MESILGLLAFIAIMILLIVLLFRYTRKKHREKNELFKDLANRLQLNYTEKTQRFMILPRLEGFWRDKELLIYEKVVGSGKNQTIFTVVEFPTSPYDFNFKIGKEHFFSKVGKKLGFKDIEFDNFELDQKFLFKAKEEDQFKSMMNYKLLHELSGIEASLVGNIENIDRKLSYTITGIVNKPDKMAKLESVMGFLVKLMET